MSKYPLDDPRFLHPDSSEDGPHSPPLWTKDPDDVKLQITQLILFLLGVTWVSTGAYYLMLFAERPHLYLFELVTGSTFIFCAFYTQWRALGAVLFALAVYLFVQAVRYWLNPLSIYYGWWSKGLVFVGLVMALVLVWPGKR